MRIQNDKQPLITFSKPPFKRTVHGISTRSLGSIRKKGAVNQDVLLRICDLIGASGRAIVMADQIHGGNVVYYDHHSSKIIENTDGLVTDSNKVILCITNADCLSITMYDPSKNIIGVCHAGYKGLLSGVVENLLNEFLKKGSKVGDLYVGFGPAIGRCCYNVSFERIELFKKTYPFLEKFYERRGGVYFLDIVAVALQILLHEGIIRSHLEDIKLCTQSNLDRFFSFRGDSKESFGQFGTFVGIL